MKKDTSSSLSYRTDIKFTRDQSTFGKRIQYLRKLEIPTDSKNGKRMTQEELAKKVNISFQRLQDIEQDKVDKISWQEIELFCNFFHVHSDVLIYGASPQNYDDHRLTGLNNNAIEWLKQINENGQTELLDMVNFVLGDPTIATVLFKSLLFYCNGTFSKTIESTTATYSDIKGLEQAVSIKTLIAGYICDVIDGVSLRYNQKKEQLDEERVRELLKKHLSRTSTEENKEEDNVSCITPEGKRLLQEITLEAENLGAEKVSHYLDERNLDIVEDTSLD